MQTERTLSIGIREAKAKFSALIRKVREGTVVTISDRGEQVARIIPMPQPKQDLQRRLQWLEESGWIRRAPKAAHSKRRPLALPKDIDLQALLQQDRNRLMED